MLPQYPVQSYATHGTDRDAVRFMYQVRDTAVVLLSAVVGLGAEIAERSCCRAKRLRAAGQNPALLTLKDASKSSEVLGPSACHGCSTPSIPTPPPCSIPAMPGSMPPPCASTACLARRPRERGPTRATDVPHDDSLEPNDNTPSPSQRTMPPNTAQ